MSSEVIGKIPLEEIPKVPSDSDGMIVRLSRMHRQNIQGLTDGKNYYVPSIAIRQGIKIIFIVALEEGMPDREECLKIKKQGMLLGLPVTREEIAELDIGDIDFIQFDIVNKKNNNQLAFKVEIRRKEDLKNC